MLNPRAYSIWYDFPYRQGARRLVSARAVGYYDPVVVVPLFRYLECGRVFRVVWNLKHTIIQEMDSHLPSFNSPPVVEVVMGVQFQPLEQLQSPYFGLFWETVRSEYSTCKENPPITPQLEDLGRPGAFKDMRLQVTQVPPLPRVFFEDASGQWLIQLQRDRFLHNWRSGPGDGAYPRYPAVREKFFSQWSNFQRFVAENGLGGINVTQLEITYLNHVVPWTDQSELGDLFPDFRWRKGNRRLGAPEAYNISYAFTLSDSPSRLRATVRPGIHREKGDILLFELTVRGVAGEGDLEGWFDNGRDWIVTAFADLTSDEWHKKWERVR